jgi:anthranilate synthase component 1
VGSNGHDDSGVALETTREEFVSMAADRPAVIRMEAPLPVDVEPLEAYATLAGETGDGPPSRYAFLLESAEKVPSSDPDGAFAPTPEDRHARFSFVGYDPAAVVTVGPDATGVEALDDRYEGLCTVGDGDVLDSVRSAMPDVSLQGFREHERRQLDGGLVGFVTYEAVYDLSLSEVGVDRPESSFPDAEFVLNTKTLAFDHAAGTVSLVLTPVVRPEDDPGEVYDSLAGEADRVASRLADVDAVETGGVEIEQGTAGSQEDYEAAVERAREAVYDGEIYQGVISRKRELYCDVDALGFYESLRETNPSPYMYLLSHGDQTIVGASPETLVSVSDGRVVSNPIAGTCPRGNSPVEDRRLAGEMLADEKERAEHTMLVDLARNDVRRVAEAGSVRVEEFMNVLKYSHVQHIESTVTGELAADQDAYDAVRASFPAGTLSGAPKIRAMELIRELEADARGPYGGGVGYVSWQGDADFAIVIRSAAVETLDQAAAPTDAPQRLTVQAGAGIVADSEPAAEYEETEKKMGAVLDALDRIATEPTEDSGDQQGESAIEQHTQTTDSLEAER